MKKIAWQKISFLSLFAMAFAWVEAVVVVYIRKIMGLENTIDLDRVFINQANSNILRMEQTREIATIVILISLAFIAFKDSRLKTAAFLWAFGIWDIFYYVFLKILIGWPASFATIDCLFLIPCPWIAPVWVPISVSLTMLLISAFLFLKGTENI